VPRCSGVSFHGISEFFIDSDFFRLVQLSGQHGVRLLLNTNGSVCTPKHIECLTSYPARLQINFSVDAATPETFARIRGWDFWRVLRNVRSYMQALASREHSTWSTLSYVILRSNLHEMVPFMYLASALGVNGVNFYRLHEYEGLDYTIPTKDGGTFDYRDEYVTNVPSEYNRQIDNVRKAAEILGLTAAIPAEVGLPNEESAVR
jgi:molybdenum cofactor biosynthesis enzyme MoaA